MGMFSSMDILIRGFIEITLMTMIYFAIYSVAIGIAYRMTIFHNVLSVSLLLTEVLLQIILLNNDYMQMFRYVLLIAPKPSPQVPIGVLFPLLLIFIIGNLIISIRLQRWKKTRVTVFSLKEGADKLPSGICLYYDDGRIVMINTRMSGLYSELTGNLAYNGNEIWSDLKNGFINDAEVEYQSEGNLIIRMYSGEVWSFEKKGITTSENFAWQIVAVDVTDSYGIYRNIQEKAKKLQQVNDKLQDYSHIVEDMTREEEILRVKIKIHDELGKMLLSTKYFIENDMSGIDAEQLLDMWKRNINLIRADAELESDENYLKILTYAAETIGVKINWNGEITDCDIDATRILIQAGKESLTNIVRHADGNELFINVIELPEQWNFEFYNNGKQPEAPITEGGGLSGLRKNVEAAGGCMKIESYPMFKLVISMPKEGCVYYDEGYDS